MKKLMDSSHLILASFLFGASPVFAGMCEDAIIRSDSDDIESLIYSVLAKQRIKNSVIERNNGHFKIEDAAVFSLDKILSLTTGRALTRESVAVYLELAKHLLNFSDMFNIELLIKSTEGPKNFIVARNYVLEQFPDLKSVQLDAVNLKRKKNNRKLVEEWLKRQEALFGTHLVLLKGETTESIDLIDRFERIFDFVESTYPHLEIISFNSGPLRQNEIFIADPFSDPTFSEKFAAAFEQGPVEHHINLFKQFLERISSRRVRESFLFKIRDEWSKEKTEEVLFKILGEEKKGNTTQSVTENLFRSFL